jgi:hypothetical protein
MSITGASRGLGADAGRVCVGMCCCIRHAKIMGVKVIFAVEMVWHV